MGVFLTVHSRPEHGPASLPSALLDAAFRGVRVVRALAGRLRRQWSRAGPRNSSVAVFRGGFKSITLQGGGPIAGLSPGQAGTQPSGVRAVRGPGHFPRRSPLTGCTPLARTRRAARRGSRKSTTRTILPTCILAARSPHNVIELLSARLIVAMGVPFWIDIETGVRTDGLLDVDKCAAVCAAVYG